MFLNARLLYKIQVAGDVIVLNWQVDGQCLICCSAFKDLIMYPVSDLYLSRIMYLLYILLVLPHVRKGTKTKRQGSLTGQNKHLARVVVNGVSEVSLLIYGADDVEPEKELNDRLFFFVRSSLTG